MNRIKCSFCHYIQIIILIGKLTTMDLWICQFIPTWDNCGEEGKEDIVGELEDDVLVVDLHGAVEASKQDKQGRGPHLHQGAHPGYLEVH